MVKEIINKIYSIIDIETTGGKFNFEKITEIAIFKIDTKGNVTKFHQLINPKKKIQPFVEKLTGINNKMLIDKPIFREVANEINRFTKDSIFVAHNVNFDYRVLKKEFNNIGIEFKRNLRFNCDKIITKLPIKKILTLWYFEKYFDLGSITKLAAISEIINV